MTRAAPQPLHTLVDDAPQPAPGFGLIPELRALYGGDLVIPPPPAPDRPLIYANFVTTLDGVISYNLPGKDTGNAISGNNVSDHIVMGILRAEADAVVWGAGTFASARRFTPTPAAIWPPGKAWFTAQRARLGKAPRPLAIVVTGSGKIDVSGAIFQQPEQPALVITTDAGLARLADLNAAPNTRVRSVGAGPEVAPDAVARIAREEFGVMALLHEGGPALFGAFLQAGLIDQLFLTTAPQFAGRAPDTFRPALVQNAAFTPATAPWASLLSLKHGGAVLFARYEIRR